MSKTPTLYVGHLGGGPGCVSIAIERGIGSFWMLKTGNKDEANKTLTYGLKTAGILGCDLKIQAEVLIALVKQADTAEELDDPRIVEDFRVAKYGHFIDELAAAKCECDRKPTWCWPCEAHKLLSGLRVTDYVGVPE